jgi:hypothetical protein
MIFKSTSPPQRHRQLAEQIGFSAALERFRLMANPDMRGANWTIASMPEIIEGEVKKQVLLSFSDVVYARHQSALERHALGAAQKVINIFQEWDKAPK